MMSNKILINIIYLTLGIILVGLFGIAIDQKISFMFIDIGVSFFILTSGYLIVKEGSFIKTLYFRLFGIGLSAIIIGAMFKVMHWPYYALILAFGFGSIVLVYLIYQINNRSRRWIGWVKLLCLTLLLLSKYFRTMHWPYNDEIYVISVSLLVVIVFEYIKRDSKLNLHS